MTDLFILSDPVSVFGSDPKRGLNHIFDMFALIGSIKTFSKVLGDGMNVGPYMAYILYI